MPNRNSQPIVSLLIPVYNVEKYLAECLDSALAQTLSNIEIICIDDGSTDASGAMLDEYAKKDPRVKVIHKQNSGYGASMNRGLDAATGEFIGILESDDTMLPNGLEVLHNAAKKHGANVVKGNFNFYWSTPNERIEPFPLVLKEECGRLVDVIEEPRIFHQKPSIWSGLYNREFLVQNGIRFLETPGASYQDTSFAFKAFAAAKKAAFVQDAIINDRQDNESSSVNNRGKVFCVCEEYAEIERWLSELGEGDRARLLFPVEQTAKYDSYMWNYVRLAPEFRLDFLQCMQKEFQAALNAGHVALSDFQPWKRVNLKLILESPEKFERENATYADAGAAGRAMHYLKHGGPSTLFAYARARMNHEL